MNTGAPANENRYTILHIDHDLTGLARLRVTLSTFPHLRCLSSPCALIGLEIARFRHPDLILLDVDLPGINLADILSELERDPRTRDIPVIAVSANDTDNIDDTASPATVRHPVASETCPPGTKNRPAAGGGLRAIIRKPLSGTELLRILE